MGRLAAAAVCLASLAAAAPAAADEVLAAIFSDHAVLQRDRPIPLWGRATPGETVTVRLGDAATEARADAQGRWRADLPPHPAGGPFLLTARTASGAEETARDVLVGDVWLCSGQSNMELPVSRALNAPSVIRASADDEIRLLTVKLDHAPQPLDEFRNPVAWAAAGPDTVGQFSAACYFFARDLRRDHDVPMGLISSAWGGSAIQAWLGAATLAASGYEEGLSILAQLPVDPVAAHGRWGLQWQNWWARHGQGEPWSPDDAGDWTPVPAMQPWETWGVPELAAYNGMMWYRADVELTAEQAAQAASLSLGNVDEADQTWVNGVAVGAAGSGDRLYALPPGLLKAGTNTVVVNAYDTWEVGGLYGPPEKRALVLADGTRVALDAGGWRYRAVPDVRAAPPRAPWGSTSGLGTIANAMISPLDGYGLRGALWYQGESNTGEPERYQDLLSAFMADWRGRFGLELPFLVVQLANFGPPPTEPGPSGWAQLREAQRLAVAADRHAGLAVAIDIGDRWDIHPAQKEELGRRLARAARHVVYGQDLPASGPVPVAARREGDTVVVSFDDVTGGLATLGSDTAIAFELCGEGGADCRYVPAAASGREVRLAAPAGAPADEVRFCWADSPVCNLVDGSGLPAGPFRLPVR